ADGFGIGSSVCALRVLPSRRRKSKVTHYRMDSAVQDQSMTLVVIRPAVIPPDVGRIDGRAEEELPRIVQRLRVGVGDAVVSPSHWLLHEGDVQAVIVRVG